MTIRRSGRMNAQEAIADIEDRLRLLTKYAVRDYERQEIEALSIVLESAKYLHEKFVFREITEHFSGKKIIYLDTDFEEMKIITNEKARRMGIVEGADE